MTLRSLHIRFAALLVFLPGPSFSAEKPLELDTILTSVSQQYPPLLATWFEQDIANGKVRRAEGSFDSILSAALMTRPAGFYEAVNGEVRITKPLRNTGGEIYGGYRVTSGFLPNYERKIRTADGGEAVLGVRLPLLRGRDIDDRRANFTKAQLDRELTNPTILRQYLNFMRAGRITYFNWLAAGKKLEAAEQLLEVAKERDDALAEQFKQGAIARIVRTDNRRLVVSRQIAVVKARQTFEGAGIALSLFHRDPKTGTTVMPTREQLPKNFPTLHKFEALTLVNDRGRALYRRPEIRQLELLTASSHVDQRLATNNLKPNLDLSVELNQAIGGNLPSDIEETEVTALLNYSIPIGRNEARGRLEAIAGRLAQLEKQKQFAHESILADANNSFAALGAAFLALEQTSLNVELSEELEAAESEKFENGASDLLALQIREGNTFDAKVLVIDANNAYFKALADYLAAVAKDAPSHLTPVSR
ncbi:TolC family protein [bacterium]|nr:TolC family protein [bacterium]